MWAVLSDLEKRVFFFWTDSFIENLFRMHFGSRVTCFRFLVYFSTKIKEKEEMTDGFLS